MKTPDLTKLTDDQLNYLITTKKKVVQYQEIKNQLEDINRKISDLRSKENEILEELEKEDDI